MCVHVCVFAYVHVCALLRVRVPLPLSLREFVCGCTLACHADFISSQQLNTTPLLLMLC